MAPSLQILSDIDDVPSQLSLLEAEKVPSALPHTRHAPVPQSSSQLSTGPTPGAPMLKLDTVKYGSITFKNEYNSITLESQNH